MKKDPFCIETNAKITDTQIYALVNILDLDQNG